MAHIRNEQIEQQNQSQETADTYERLSQSKLCPGLLIVPGNGLVLIDKSEQC